MNTTKFNFDRDFQISLLALLVQKYDFLVTVVGTLKSEYFEDDILAWFYKTIRDYFLDYKQTADQLVIKNEILKALKQDKIKSENIKSYLNVFRELYKPVSSKEYIIHDVIQFCRQQETKAAFLECSEKILSNEIDEWVIERVRKAVTVGEHTLDLGTQYFVDYPERIRKHLAGEDKIIIPTGITDADFKLGGGLKSGQLGCWVGATGRGKSVSLAHCGKRAIIGGYKVVHYTLELSVEDICERYDSSWSTIPIYKLDNHYDEVEAELNKLGKRYGNSLIVKELPTYPAVTVDTIYGHVQQLKGIGFVPDLIIVDYADYLSSNTRYTERHEDIAQTYVQLRGLAKRLHIPIWTASQINASGYDSDVLDIEHLEGAKAKGNISDVVIGICMSNEERKNNEARLFFAKNRNGPAGVIVPIHTAYERMCFYDPLKRELERKELPNPISKTKEIEKNLNEALKLV